jgi:hypothetical protein
MNKEASGDWLLDPSRSDYGIAPAHPCFTSRRIESHQDDKTPLAKIDHYWGQLIVEYDGFAKNYLNTDALAGGWQSPGVRVVSRNERLTKPQNKLHGCVHL